MTLIGYCKVPKPDTQPSRAVLLGTLSPTHGEAGEGEQEKERPQSVAYPLRSTPSTTSLLTRTCWSRGSATSLPEFSDLSQFREGGMASSSPVGSAATPAISEGMERVELEEVDGSLAGSLGQKRAVFKAQRSYTAPVVEIPHQGVSTSAANLSGSPSSSSPLPHRPSHSQRETTLPNDRPAAAVGAESSAADVLSLSAVDCDVHLRDARLSGVEVDEEVNVANGYDDHLEGGGGGGGGDGCGDTSVSVASTDSGVAASANRQAPSCDNPSPSSQSRESGIVSDSSAALGSDSLCDDMPGQAISTTAIVNSDQKVRTESQSEYILFH